MKMIYIGPWPRELAKYQEYVKNEHSMIEYAFVNEKSQEWTKVEILSVNKNILKMWF